MASPEGIIENGAGNAKTVVVVTVIRPVFVAIGGPQIVTVIVPGAAAQNVPFFTGIPLNRRI